LYPRVTFRPGVMEVVVRGSHASTTVRCNPEESLSVADTISEAEGILGLPQGRHGIVFRGRYLPESSLLGDHGVEHLSELVLLPLPTRSRPGSSMLNFAKSAQARAMEDSQPILCDAKIWRGEEFLELAQAELDFDAEGRLVIGTLQSDLRVADLLNMPFRDAQMVFVNHTSKIHLRFSWAACTRFAKRCDDERELAKYHSSIAVDNARGVPPLRKPLAKVARPAWALTHRLNEDLVDGFLEPPTPCKLRRAASPESSHKRRRTQ